MYLEGFGASAPYSAGVKKIQEALVQHGFELGRPDGRYGMNTHAALVRALVANRFLTAQQQSSCNTLRSAAMSVCSNALRVGVIVLMSKWSVRISEGDGAALVGAYQAWLRARIAEEGEGEVADSDQEVVIDTGETALTQPDPGRPVWDGSRVAAAVNRPEAIVEDVSIATGLRAGFPWYWAFGLIAVSGAAVAAVIWDRRRGQDLGSKPVRFNPAGHGTCPYCAGDLSCEMSLPTVCGPWDLCAEASKVLQKKDVEHFVVFALDARNRIVGKKVVSQGTVSSTMVHPRDVFRFAVKKNASAVVVAHNHPSGDPRPSPEDQELTKRLKQAGALLGIGLLDHVVVGRYRCDSVVYG